MRGLLPPLGLGSGRCRSLRHRPHNLPSGRIFLGCHYQTRKRKGRLRDTPVRLSLFHFTSPKHGALTLFLLPGASQRSRRDRSTTPSLDVLRAQLDSPSMSGRGKTFNAPSRYFETHLNTSSPYRTELNDTPARPLRNSSNPLYAEIESVDFNSERESPPPSPPPCLVLTHPLLLSSL